MWVGLGMGHFAPSSLSSPLYSYLLAYRYDLELVHSRNQAYVVKHSIDASPEVQELLLP